MKKFVLPALLFACASTFAQEKVKEVVTNSYDRNSISIVVIDRGDSSDQKVYDAIRNIKYGDKFDKNYIATDRVKVEKPRELAPVVTEINGEITGTTIGHQIVKYWFDSDKNGMMDGALVEERGRFNVSDEDVMSAKSAKIGESALRDTGYALINSSYIMALDCSKFIDGKTSSGEPTKGVTVTACVYKVNFPTEMQEEFYDKCWIDESTPKSEIAARKSAFSKMTFQVEPITYAAASATAQVKDGGLSTAIAAAYEAALRNLENKIKGWQVITPVKEVKPLRAKIGTKEGLKNTHRYAAYTMKGKEVDGEIVMRSKMTGYVRASKVASNSANATGESPMSEFYQISHVKNIEAGELLRQSNDLAMGVMVGYSIGGLSAYNVNIDYLLNINTKGTSQYALMDFGYDMPEGNGELTYITAALGYGYGLKATRFIEIMPFVMGGADYLQLEGSEDETEDEMMEKMAYFAKAGLKATFTVAYPFQVVVGANYSYIASEGVIYNYYNSPTFLEDKREGGLAFTLGLKYTF